MTNLQQWIACLTAADAHGSLPAFGPGATLKVPDSGHAPPIVVPEVIATHGTVHLYADGSVWSDELEAYAAGYTGKAEKCYGLFFEDTKAVFGITKDSNPVAYGNIEANRAQTHSPFAVGYNWHAGQVMQGVQAALKPDGMLGPSSALRGTLSTRLNVADIPAIIAAWKSASPPYYPTQIDASTSGDFYAGTAR